MPSLPGGFDVRALKARPVITLADFLRAGTGVVGASEPRAVTYLSHGTAHTVKLRGMVLAGMLVGIFCPCCGEGAEHLFAEPGRPGVCCDKCLMRRTLADE